ncbi:MAG: hypothetical protein V7K41_21400 [Nostoc sp.]|uniref:hypothetical protein n=1 Tax=Nostoc sp. TaxID=1180 RepID=UPI002FFAB7D8
MDADICTGCGIINLITPRDILWTKSTNSGNTNIKDNTWQDSNTRDRPNILLYHVRVKTYHLDRSSCWEQGAGGKRLLGFLHRCGNHK